MDRIIKIDGSSILAAGPVMQVKSGITQYKRVVLRTNHEGSRYRVSTQVFNKDGIPVMFEELFAKLFDDYQEAFTCWFEWVGELHKDVFTS